MWEVKSLGLKLLREETKEGNEAIDYDTIKLAQKMIVE